MMEGIVTFCDKTLENTKQEIANCEKNFIHEKEKFNKIEKTTKGIEEATKIVLERRKFKKFNYLKYNPQKRLIAIAEDDI